MHSQTAHPVGVYRSCYHRCNLKPTSLPTFRFKHDTAVDTTMIQQVRRRRKGRERGETASFLLRRREGVTSQLKRPDGRSCAPTMCSGKVPCWSVCELDTKQYEEASGIVQQTAFFGKDCCTNPLSVTGKECLIKSRDSGGQLSSLCW